jgi:hypothetical protein
MKKAVTLPRFWLQESDVLDLYRFPSVSLLLLLLPTTGGLFRPNHQLYSMWMLMMRFCLVRHSSQHLSHLDLWCSSFSLGEIISYDSFALYRQQPRPIG